jgi:hypothetical protein
METRDVSGTVDNSNVTLAGGFPFISGDKLVMYLRPKIVFAAQTKAEQSTSLLGFADATTLSVPVYDLGRKSSAGGSISGQVYTESSSHPSNTPSYGFHMAFQGTSTTDTEKWITKNNNNNKYSTSFPWNYAGIEKTQNVDGSSELLGEWGQVDIGQNTVITKFEMWAQQGYNMHRCASDFSLLGSLDGTNWTTIKAVSGLSGSDWDATSNGNTPAGSITWELSSTKGPYRYYRLSIQSVTGGGADGIFNLLGLLLYGVKSSEVSNIGDTKSLDISGLQTNIVATAQNIEDAFPGNATSGPEPEINKWGWMGSTNSDSLTLETTDVTDVRTCDLHIWKITITL